MDTIRRVAEVARLVTDAGLIKLVSFISPFRSERRMARAGEIPNVTGIGSSYEPPEPPELPLRSDQVSPDEFARQVIGLLNARGMLSAARAQRDDPSPLNASGAVVTRWLIRLTDVVNARGNR